MSTVGTYLALDAFPMIAILALDASAAQVSLIAAISGAIGALLAVPLGPWVEFRRKRPLMIRADVVRFLVLLTIPAAYVLGALSYPQLVAVAVVTAAADIVFVGASGAHLKGLVPANHLMTANGRFETVLWVSTAVGPPLGGAMIGVLGPVVTVVLNAGSFLLSALGIRAIRAPEATPPERTRTTWRDVGEGWRVIARDRVLRLLFANTVSVAALIMATAPLLAFLMLNDLGFTTAQYGLALGIPCVGGIVGSRVARPLARRLGAHRVLLAAGVARVMFFVPLAFIGSGTTGLLTVIALQFCTVTCMSVFIPVFATFRLQRTEDGKVARMLTAWTITSRTTVAVTTALWGGLAAITSVRAAMVAAGALLIATSVLLPWSGFSEPTTRR